MCDAVNRSSDRAAPQRVPTPTTGITAETSKNVLLGSSEDHRPPPPRPPPAVLSYMWRQKMTSLGTISAGG